MKLDIKYSQKFEIERVKNTLKKLNWFEEHGYRPWLPQKINQNNTEDKIKTAVNKEYNEEDYKKVAIELFDSFGQIGGRFDQTLQEVFAVVPNKITVHITRYGAGGSYNLPNTIILNFQMSDLLKTALHEIVHLIIEPFVQKYKIGHWEKERIVDLILHSDKFLFLHFDLWQCDYHGAKERVDELFKKTFFKSPEKFFASINRYNKYAKNRMDS